MRLKFRLTPPSLCAKCDYPNIRVGALRIMSRVHGNGTCNGGWNIFGWHREQSITWRWFLAWNPSRLFMCGMHAGKNGHGQIRFGAPFIGEFSIHWQPHMWKSE